VLKQDYPHFDVIVMNDYSNDRTSEILNDFRNRFSTLKVYQPSKNIAGKKLSIYEAVTFTNSDWILLTDADCVTKSSSWLKNMMSEVNSEVDLVLGYGAYRKGAGVLNKLIRYETVYIALQYLSAAVSGKAYMGVSRNLAFRKRAFLEKNPFQDRMYGPGDDDAIVQSISNMNNTAICIDGKAHTLSNPKPSIKEYFIQKKRHISPVSSYSVRRQLWLSLLGMSHIGVLILVAVLGMSEYWGPSILMIVLRWLIMIVFALRLFPLFQEKRLILFIPIADVLLALFYFFQLLCIPIPKKGW
jgi:glycosyltransferase involved in cell wall biosynthesis